MKPDLNRAIMITDSFKISLHSLMNGDKNKNNNKRIKKREKKKEGEVGE